MDFYIIRDMNFKSTMPWTILEPFAGVQFGFFSGKISSNSIHQEGV